MENKLMMQEPSDSNSEAGKTVALIDAVISICDIISIRDLFDDAGIIQEALKDLRSNDGMKRLMDIGELQDAKDYIQEQKKIMKLLLATSKLTDEALKEFGDKLKESRETPHDTTKPQSINYEIIDNDFEPLYYKHLHEWEEKVKASMLNKFEGAGGLKEFKIPIGILKRQLIEDAFENYKRGNISMEDALGIIFSKSSKTN